ncbi:MAG: helix-turn-helix domain-containing protein [Bacteroidales bacterium]|nr:helix-turn-helix domain-containing protein [Bacteroidales bacterium]
MNSLVDIVYNIELSLLLGVLTSFVLGFLLMLIKIPHTEYAKKIAKGKNTIAVCFLVCAVLFFITLSYSGIPDYDTFVALMMFIITAMSSAILSYSLINVLDENYVDNDKFLINIGVTSIVSYVLIKAFWWDNGWPRTVVMVTAIVLFIVQCISHIIVFNKVYVSSSIKLEQYYDEEEDDKIRWIRFCYIIMMLTQMFILVYLLLPTGFMKVYVSGYSLFILYFTANFISFLGSHKLLLDAFAYKTLSGKDFHRKRRAGSRALAREMRDDSINASGGEADFRSLEHSIDKWVEEKRYREYDKSREDIAKELNTTKETLHLYFTTKMGVDFKSWRTALRIEEAKRMLLENRDLSVHIVGELSGFSDRSNFHRQFTKLVGCSPKQWRESEGLPEE